MPLIKCYKCWRISLVAMCCVHKHEILWKMMCSYTFRINIKNKATQCLQSDSAQWVYQGVLLFKGTTKRDLSSNVTPHTQCLGYQMLQYVIYKSARYHTSPKQSPVNECWSKLGPLGWHLHVWWIKSWIMCMFILQICLYCFSLLYYCLLWWYCYSTVCLHLLIVPVHTCPISTVFITHNINVEQGSGWHFYWIIYKGK